MYKRILVCIFLVLTLTLLLSPCFAIELTSARYYHDIPSQADGETKYTLSGEFGYYIPSLKTFNDSKDSSSKINGGFSLYLKILFRGVDDYWYLGAGYWSGSSTATISSTGATLTSPDTTKINLITPFAIGYGFPITITPEVKLNIAFQGSWIISSYSWEYKTSSVLALGPLGYNLGIIGGSEYFIIPDVLSVSGNIGYIFLGSVPFLTVTSSNVQSTVSGQRLKKTDGSDFSLELDGIYFMPGVNFYF